MFFILFPLFTTIIYAINIKSIIDTAVKNTIDEQCPFHDMKGLNRFCDNIRTSLHDNNNLLIKLGTGWDPISAEIKLPFFHLTYTQNKTYISSSKIKYMIPDQITITSKNVPTSTTTKNVYTNIDEYLSKMNPNRSNVSSGTLSLPIDMISNFFHFFDSGNNNIVSVIESVATLDLNFTGTQIISPFAQSALDSLPTSYDPTVYKMFLDYWGTQIVIGGTAGGIAEQTIMIKSCFGMLDGANQAALYMLKQFHPEQYSNISFSAGFQQYSKASVIDMFGGDPKFVSSVDWKQRLKTMDDFPVLTNVIVKPIIDFIANQSTRANMLKAINDYYASGNDRLNGYKQTYLSSLNGPKSISFFAARYPPNTIISSSQFLLGPGGTASVPKTPLTNIWTPTQYYEGFICTRTGNKSIRSFVDGEFIGRAMMSEHSRFVNGRSKLTVNSAGGLDVVAGCSASVYTLDIGRKNSWGRWGPTAMYGYCCMDCIPDIRCPNNNCQVVDCRCPSF